MTTRHLTCTCCGSSAGQWQQHWNQDIGYGLCARCRDWIWERNHGGDTRATFERTYGKPGINYAPWPEGHQAATPDPITAYYTDRANGHHAAKAP